MTTYQTRDERALQAELTIATLCDMVLGKDALDRSDEHLICAVELLLRVVNAARADAEPTMRVQLALSKWDAAREGEGRNEQEN